MAEPTPIPDPTTGRTDRVRQAATRDEAALNPEGKAAYWLDVDRMINEGLGGGIVSPENGLIDEHRPLERETPPADGGEATASDAP
ncbi:hypothetical protein [Hydrogenibacillus sp. N12]|uniref:hypothetical protein n=1 Tax=Hydrogenibacillus sp. N12 TaxID=2866627 RepID=UPI001C7CAEF8|nr:hypothetical protein [Hydrogenibacillus sp. N12]QZA34340.1 hypothetical protein K2M58_08665 [Hydrogenibacillus sp. N12]